MGRLQQIQCGKDHTLNLTRDGDVFSHGVGTFCAAGHGGSRAAEKPQILKPLRDKRVIQIACGEHHSLVLTDKGYLYAWGRGFEGQLGISNTIEVAATPSFVKYFHKKTVASIAAGSFHSIAITEEGDLYTWGEGKMGQLGVGCVRQKRMPE
jgi:alpha-tubulin suppressor-like RCC1 family protein